MANFTLKQDYLLLNLDQDIQLLKSVDLYCSTLTTSNKDSETRLKKLLKKSIEEIHLSDLFRLNLLSKPEQSILEIIIPKRDRDLFRENDFIFKFHFLKWDHVSDNIIVSYIPDIDFFTLLKKSTDWKELLKIEVLNEIKRKKYNLFELSKINVVKKISVKEVQLNVSVPTMLEDFSENVEDRKEGKVIKKVANVIAVKKDDKKYELVPYLKIMADFLTGEDLQSLLLCGPSGCGKTSAIQELIRCKEDYHLVDWSFWESSGARIVAGMSGFGMWQERCENLIKEIEGKKYIFHMGSLLELMDVGKSVSNSQGIASWFKPMMSRGKIVIIVECTPEQLSLIEREDPYLLHVMNIIDFEKPEEEKVLKILKLLIENKYNHFNIEDQVLETIIELHSRFAPYSAYPARPIRFLDNLIQDKINLKVVTLKDVYQVFSKETGIPTFIIDNSLSFDKDKTLKFLRSRVMGQDFAVKEIYKLLTVIKSNMDRASKPIASFLFIGPSGTGKTEMSKTLAEYLFANQSKLIRFDMSEYSSFDSIDRLIGKGFGSDGLLVSRVREEPFSVILFDEFEKASPRFYDLLLQILDAGKLTDAQGKIADFCSTVIIMTSNLGAQTFSKSNFGFKNVENGMNAMNHFQSEVQKFLRPEIYNRIDKIVPFLTLEKNVIKEICKREVNLISKRDGIAFRDIEINIEDNVINLLADKGFDILYGARPIKRAITDQLLSKLADAINQFQEDQSLKVDVNADGKEICVNVKTSKSIEKQIEKRVATGKKNVDRIMKLRRVFDRLNHCARSLKLRNKITELNSLNYNINRKLKKKKWVDPAFLEKLESLKKYEELQIEKQNLEQNILELEKDILLSFYKDKIVEDDQIQIIEQFEKDLEKILIKIYSMDYEDTDRIIISIYSKKRAALKEALENYILVLESMDFKYKLFNIEIFPFSKSIRQQSQLNENMEENELNENEENLSTFLIEPFKENKVVFTDQSKGILFEITGKLSRLKFETESGIHQLKDDNMDFFIETSHLKPEKYKPQKLLLKKLDFSLFDVRRVYNRDKLVIEDKRLNKRYQWGNRKLDKILTKIINDNLNYTAYSILEE